MFSSRHLSLQAKRSNPSLLTRIASSLALLAMTIKRILKSESGQALPMALILLLFGGFFVVPCLALMSTTLNANRMVDRKALELYAADAGVEHALWRLQYDDELSLPDEGEDPLPLDFPNETIKGMTAVDVTLTNVGGQTYKITSIATSDDGDTTIKCYVQISGGTFASAITVTDGDLYIEDTTIDGDIWVSGEFTSEGSTVTGDVLENQNGELDPLDSIPYKDEALAGTTFPTTGQTISEDTIWATAVYITGDLKIEEGVTLTIGGTVWVTGSIHVEGTEETDTLITGQGNLIAETGNMRIEYLKLDTTNMPLVWAIEGDIEKIETNQYIKAIIYAPEGDIQIEETDVIYGAVFGQTVSLMENCSIDYADEEEDPDGLLGDGGVQMLTYTIE